jgi:hypothetical protein
MTIISPVITDGISSGGYSGSPEYVYNGTDMYATFSEWTPNNIVLSYGCDAVVDVAATGAIQIIMTSRIELGNHRVYITGTGGLRASYTGVDGVVYYTGGVQLVDGESFSPEVRYTSEKAVLYNNGVLVGNSATGAPELAAISSLAANLTPALYFGGTISNVRLTSSSPMQNVNVMAGNGVDRYASIPTFSPVAFTSKQWVRQNSLASTTRVFGNSSSLSSRMDITVSGSIRLTDSSDNTLESSSGDIIEGQDHYVETEVLADGSCEIWVDGVSQASASTGAFDGLAWDINSIHRQDTAYGTGIITNQVFRNLDTGITHTYNNTDNYERLGSELTPDSNNLSNWTRVGGGAVLSSDGDFIVATNTDVISRSCSARYDTITTTGKKYIVSVFVGALTGSGVLYFGFGANDSVILEEGLNEFTYVAVDDETSIRVKRFSLAGTSFSFTNVSVKEAPVILPDSTVTEYGDELLVDGAWTGTAIITDVDGFLTIDRNGGSFAGACDQTLATTIGSLYVITGSLVSETNTTSIDVNGPDIFFAWEGEDLYFTAIASSTTITIAPAGSTAEISVVDNMSVVEVIAIADTQDGTWVNATIDDLDYLPYTDRVYFCTEGTGDTLYDSKIKVASTNATIQNFVEGSWNNP